MINVINKLLLLFDENNIQYCHWKSTQHLDLSFQGMTDLDVLIEKHQFSKVDCLLSKVGFKKFEVAKNRRYPYIYDYLAYDKGSDKIVHLHLHTRLNIGPKHHKYILFPYEELILNHRERDPDFGSIYRIKLSHELLLLIIRQSIKFRYRDYFLLFLRGFKHHPSFLREFEWLIKRVSFDDFLKAAEMISGKSNIISENGITSYTHFYSPYRVLKLKSVFLNKVLVPLESNLKARVNRWIREINRIIYEVYGKLNWSHSNRRRIYNDGVVIAFVGGDGSGKSSISYEAYKRCKKQFNTKKVYLGTGDGANSLLLTLLKPVHKLLHRKKILSVKGKMDSLKERNSGSKESFFRSLFYLPWSLVILYDRYYKLKVLKKYIMKGFVIITDRYPQSDIPNVFDGPKLKRWMSGIEKRIIYQYAALDPIILRFECNPEVTCTRKPEITREQAVFNANTLKNISLYTNASSYEINADNPYEEVVGECMSIIFNEI